MMGFTVAAANIFSVSCPIYDLMIPACVFVIDEHIVYLLSVLTVNTASTTITSWTNYKTV